MGSQTNLKIFSFFSGTRISNDKVSTLFLSYFSRRIPIFLWTFIFFQETLWLLSDFSRFFSPLHEFFPLSWLVSTSKEDMNEFYENKQDENLPKSLSKHVSTLCTASKLQGEMSTRENRVKKVDLTIGWSMRAVKGEQGAHKKKNGCVIIHKAK